MTRSETALDRRALLLAAGGLAAFSLGTTHAQDASPAASPAAAGWSFTDDKGVTVSLATMPTRIVADVNAAAALWDFGVRPVAVFGWNAVETGDFGPAGGNIDPSQVEVVGSVDEPFKPEATLAVDPDLIVTLTWEPENPDEYWSLDVDPSILPLAREIAPVVAISAAGLADVNTRRMAELAAALGADLTTPELVEAEAGFEDALVRLEDVAAVKTDLVVMFAYIADGTEWYVTDPAGWADVTLFQQLGVNVLSPDESDGWWQTLSTEEALRYPADIIFNSDRGGGTLTLGLEDLQAHPTFGLHPAVQAGQVYPWNQDFILSYQGMTAALNAISDPLEQAEKVI
jgi:iron complex transport system substrate-binding protein